MDLAVPTLVNHAASRPTSLENLHGFILHGLMCNLSKSALDRSWGLLGFLLCLRAREPTTPEPASTEGVWHIRGWACIFRRGQENRQKKFGKRPRFWSEKRRDSGADCWSHFSPRPKSSTANSNPPRDKNPCQIPKFVVGDISKCPTLVLRRRVWQAIRLSIPIQQLQHTVHDP